METIKEYRYTISIVIASLICCILISIPLLRSLNDAVTYVPPTPLSSIALQPGDLPPNIFEQKAPSADCNKYLSLQIQPDVIGQSNLECHQVKFVSYDDNIIVLSAIWVFENPALANLEIDKLSEMPPIELNQEPVPGILGEKSGASAATITGGRVPLYVSNLYWRQGAAVVRLSVLNYQAPIDLNGIMMPAKSIEARLAFR